MTALNYRAEHLTHVCDTKPQVLYILLSPCSTLFLSQPAILTTLSRRNRTHRNTATMTSEYTKNRGLSQQILSQWTHLCERPREGERLRFYLAYFQEVLPYGVSVYHIPSDPPKPTSEEVQFCLDEGKTFMCGLVLSKDVYAVDIQQLVVDEKLTRPSDKDMVINDDGSWRFFTAAAEVKVYNRLPNDEYELLGVFDPIKRAWEMAAFLQREYDGVKKRLPRIPDSMTEVW